ncbi:MAG: DUF1015 family protein [Peptococcaceae bacterium]|jgi:uncharacterized protein (DUF1015 family)|nr:DUF1015 family protein [Peptococcaceae bacterium]MDH7525559.1 DUF1015 family protein [Peptococcaceae bacterium]
MAEIEGLTGLRPGKESIKSVTCPPYDVIKAGSKLEMVLNANRNALSHITLGQDPLGVLNRLIKEGVLQEDKVPCFYVYEQSFAGRTRTGVLAAVRVYDYAEGEIIRHERTFDDKVRGRLELRAKTGYTFEPVFLLTKAPVGKILERVKDLNQPEYQFISDFEGASELHGIANRIYRLTEDSRESQQLKALIKGNPLYIADGHHRYHASLLNRQTHCLAYICEAGQVEIQAYNRVIKGTVKFDEIKERLKLSELRVFATPPKHHFAVYTKKGSYLIKARHIPDDVVGRLDCSILENELYPLLGLTREMIRDPRRFDYFPEYEMDRMVETVNAGKYDIAVALHPVSIEELMAVADAGINDSSIVMPEKSTFFVPKILSGIFIYKHRIT